MLTLFAMVLAIGILVDDAIVVVENVERIMSEEGLPPREATRKAMTQITGAIVGITLVLVAVFVPMAFFPGSVGVIYRQFSVTMVSAIAFSALMALSLTPALCATLLKQVPAAIITRGRASASSTGEWKRPRAATAASCGGRSPHRTADADLFRHRRRFGLGVRAPARRLPAGRRSGLHHHRRADATRGIVQPHLGGGEAVEEFLAQRKGVDTSRS